MTISSTTAAVISTAVSLAATAVSTGLSFYGQQQQAKNASAIANYNYEMQRRNAEVNARMAQQQAQWNQQSAMAQYQAQQNNALALEQQARATEAQGREQARRMREEQDALLARQRAAYGASGVVNEGTPLVVLADTARKTELDIQDKAYQTELESRQWLRKAEDERFQSGFSLMDAQLAEYEGAAANIGKQMAYRQADLSRMSGMATAQGYRNQSYATLISGAADMAGQSANYFYKSK